MNKRTLARGGVGVEKYVQTNQPSRAQTNHAARTLINWLKPI